MEPKQNKHLTSMCFILCNKNNYIVFVLAAYSNNIENKENKKQNHPTGQIDIYMNIIEKC